MVLRIGPCLGMALLIGIAVWGGMSSPIGASRTIVASEPSHPLTAIATWISDNREVIEPLTAIGALVVAGVVAYVTTFLYIATRNLAATTRDLANAANSQVEEMALTRTLAERNIGLQEKQFLLADKQCELAGRQHGLQREQYLAEHRPRIKIRSIGLERPKAGDLFQAELPIKGSLVIVNVGASEATIQPAEYRFLVVRGSLPNVTPARTREREADVGTFAPAQDGKTRIAPYPYRKRWTNRV